MIYKIAKNGLLIEIFEVIIVKKFMIESAKTILTGDINNMLNLNLIKENEKLFKSITDYTNDSVENVINDVMPGKDSIEDLKFLNRINTFFN